MVEASLESVAFGIVYLEKSMVLGRRVEGRSGLLLSVDVGVVAAFGTELEYGGGSDVNVCSKMVLLWPSLLLLFCEGSLGDGI